MAIIEKLKTYYSDVIGISSATLCVIHCLITPILMVLLSQITWWHEFSYFFLLISFFAAYESSKKSITNPYLYLIWVSFFVLLISVIFEEDFSYLHELSYLASAGLIIGHILNIKHCKTCEKH